MALSRIPHPAAAAAAAADTGGHHHPPLYHHHTATADHNPYPPYPRKHRPRPFPTTDADADADTGPPAKRRKPTAPGSWPQDAEKWHRYPAASDAPSTSSSVPLPPSASRSEEEAAFMSRAEIERCSPSRKDGIDSLLEAQLRYSYCAYLQSLGLRLQMPQTTIGTAMVLCHRFFVRRSHACHDRFLVATAALFLASKSEETPCLLNTVLRTSCEVCQAENLAFHPYLLSNDWFEQYRERVTEAEQMILTTLDFELDVHHPYVPLTTVLNKFGLSQTALLNLAWNFVTEGLRTSLWLQFKPNQIAAGAVFLAAKFLSFDLAFYPSIWHEFHTTPWVLQEVVQQLMEIF